MALRNAFGDLGLDSTLQAIRDRLPAALGGNGGVKVEQQGSLPTGSNTIGGVNVVDSAGTNKAAVSASGAVKVDGSAATQPVSGTVTANAGTNLNTSALATSAKQSDGSQKSQVVDGSGNVIGSTANALDVNVKSSAASNQSVNLAQVAGSTVLTSGVTGSQAVGGDTASGATDAGNPVKVGAKFNTSQPSFTDGQRGDVQIDSRGNLRSSLIAPGSGNPISSSADNVDAVAVSATANKLGVMSRNTVYNGTSWDRQAGTTAGTYGIVRDAAGNARGANVNASNQLSVSVDNSPTFTANAGTNLNTSALALETGGNLATIAANTTTLNPTPLFATISTSSSGATTIVAAVGGKKIRVLQAVLVANAAVNVKFQSHVTPTDITGLFYLAANTGFSSGYSPVGQFQTVTGEALDINLSGAVAVGGYITYVTV